ncbi:hypothetical protein [Bradyrhizobium sp.]|uniref:hypothetical protein n=1 Tax=Bradyrhizobium sp. TaxID=376 RepID=UPI001D260C28|nr:hypothetical protein [Bradyrhizobium sp.]MBV8698736.1 hypothetical protein [Bradyrhizobium sp.]MBV8921289.1 hypothetical protein [Bradyrhizobium sp.]MBV9983941.1 hypothetical protein [Bradyrhizobium sp.]
MKKHQRQDDKGPYEHDRQSAEDGGIFSAMRHGRVSRVREPVVRQRAYRASVATLGDEEKSRGALASWPLAIAQSWIAIANMMFRKSNAAFSVLALTHSSQICALRSASGLTMWIHRQLAAFGEEIHARCDSHRAGIKVQAQQSA